MNQSSNPPIDTHLTVSQHARPVSHTTIHPFTNQPIHPPNPATIPAKTNTNAETMRDPIMTRSRSAHARAEAASTAVTTSKSGPPQMMMPAKRAHIITSTQRPPQATTQTRTQTSSSGLSSLSISISSLSSISSLISLSTTTTTTTGTSQPHPSTQQPITPTTATPTLPPSAIQSLLEISLTAVRHVQIPEVEVEVVLFAATAVCLLYLGRLAMRSLPSHSFYRAGA
jgi:hypothetical protein